MLLRFEGGTAGTAAVLDMSGRMLRSERLSGSSSLSLDLRGLPAGNYVLVVESGERRFRSRFSKR